MKTIKLTDDSFHKKLKMLSVELELTMEELLKEFFNIYEERNKTTKKM